MDLLLLFISLLIALTNGTSQAQRLYQVHMEEVPPARTGSVARFRCSYIGENVTIQYVSWTKLSNDGRRVYVYEYSEHPPINKAYHDFLGRAVVKSGETSASAYRNRANQKLHDQKQNNPKPLGSGPRVDPRKSQEDQGDQLISQIQQNMLKVSGIPQSMTGSNDMLKFNDPPLVSHPKTHEEPEVHDGIKESVYGPGEEDVVGGVALPLQSSFIPVYQPEQNDTLPRDANPTDSAFMNGGSTIDPFMHSIFSIRRKKRSIPMGHIDLYLSNVQLKDEARYECTVKPIGGPALSNNMLLQVQVAPSEPAIETTLEEPLVEGQNITLSCLSNVGKPAGHLTWSLMRKGDARFSEIPNHLIEASATTLSNGTTAATSGLHITVAEEDDGAVYRCTALSDILGAYEARPFTQKTLSLQYPPRGGRILFDTAVGRYYCHSRGKPAPSYAWIWIQPDGRQTIMSTNRYLDLRGMSQSGYYRFHCLASNIINGVRHTKVMATKLRVIAPEAPSTTAAPTTSTTTTTTPEPTTQKQEVVPKFITRYGRYDLNDGSQNHFKEYVAPGPSTTANPPEEVEEIFDDPKTTSKPNLGNSKSEGFHYKKEKKPEPQSKGYTNRNYYDENLRQGRLPPKEEEKELNDVPPTVGSQSRKSYNDRKSYDDRKNDDEEQMYDERKSNDERKSYDDRKSNDDRKSYDDYRSHKDHKESSRSNRKRQKTQKREPEKPKSKKDKDAAYYYYYYNTDDDKYSKYSYVDDKPEQQQEPEGRQAPAKRRSRKHKWDYKEEESREKDESEEQEEERDPAAFKNSHEIVSRSSHSEYDCKKRPDGVYGAGCRAFFRCLNKKGYFVECKKPYVYNRRAAKCDKPDLAPAPCGIWRDCSNKKSKKYADIEFDCKNYYTCWHGFFMGHNECNPGLVFNERVQLCDWPENVPSPCGKGKRKKQRRGRSKFSG